MIVEQRTYTLHPGKVAEYLRIYETEGMEVQKRVLGRMIGYYYSDIGVVNQLVHMWAYEDLNDRQRRREALHKEPQWRAYLPKVLPLIQLQETKILIPASFSPAP